MGKHWWWIVVARWMEVGNMHGQRAARVAPKKKSKLHKKAIVPSHILGGEVKPTSLFFTGKTSPKRENFNINSSPSC